MIFLFKKAYSITNIVEIEPGSKHYSMIQSICAKSAISRGNYQNTNYVAGIQPLRSNQTYDHYKYDPYTSKYDEYSNYEDSKNAGYNYDNYYENNHQDYYSDYKE